MNGIPTPNPVPQWLRARLSEWDLDALIERIASVDTDGAFPNRRGDDHFLELLRASILENMRNMQSYLLGTVELGAFELREPAVFARKQAEIGIAQSALQHSYRLGIQVAVDHWGSIVIDEGARQELPASTVSADLLSSVMRMLAYSDHVQGLVAAEFAEQEAELRRTGQQLREQVVLDLLHRTDSVRSSDLLSIIGYDLSHAHVAVEISEVAPAEATRIVQDLRQLSGAVGVLSLHVGVAQTIFWLGRPRAWPTAAVESILDEVRRRKLTVSVTSAAVGVNGLRQTHGALGEMAKLRVDGTAIGPVLYYPDVRLEVLLLQDSAAARRFVEDELGQLAEASPVAERIRQTVAASYTYGSHVQTAIALDVHEHTVRNRLRRAEEILGHSLADRRTELQIALRLRETMGRTPKESETGGN
ncbi:helix-turn-helix domain-containing protein [Rhodococcus pseudokoreensis]|uniref:Helix-turn-helix domain-containing protein n=1 Tax=Rhodococcus pseudokoreensis TaxID=2811421 RepID=A0A974W417_9NOCA|nr:helix-turn-helix domain-containing protein [Rhodococcus pseudokoreensis]QSE90661.1 helix-turn-helix domain-containing protein [Rhodococcus pseudokoreensis]